jgi:hypothetical protein
MRTFHHDLHLFDQIRDNVKSLGNRHLRLLEGESVDTLEDGFDLILSQEILGVFFCNI